MTSSEGVVRVGLVGVNTSHADAFARLLDGKSAQAIAGARLVAIWGEQRDRRDQLAAEYSVEAVVDDPAEMAEEIDLALVIDDRGKAATPGASHRELATVFLEAGVPTFVDKPFTQRFDDAVHLLDLARRRGVPLTSSSSLRYAPELAELLRELEPHGGVTSMIGVGPNDWYYYGVHVAEAVVTVMGPGAGWVQRFAWPDRDVAVVGYPDGRSAVMEVLRDSRPGFLFVAHAPGGWAQRQILDYGSAYAQQLRTAVDMARTRRPPVPDAESLEVLAILHAGIVSAERGARVELSEFLSGLPVESVTGS